MIKATMIACGLMMSPVLATTSAHAQAASGRPPTAISADKVAIAREFAGFYIPEALVRAAGVREFEKNARASMASVPQAVEADTKYPGTINAAVAGGRAEMMKLYDDYLPKARAVVADVAVTQLSIDDLRAINRFYASATGQKVMRVLTEGVDTSALAARVKADPKNFAMKSGDAEKMVNLSGLDTLSPAEKAEMSAFNYSPAGLHFAAARPELEGKMLAVQNATFSSGMPRIQQAVQAAAQAHVTALKAKMGKQK
jgi:hypothetical protein